MGKSTEEAAYFWHNAKLSKKSKQKSKKQTEESSASASAGRFLLSVNEATFAETRDQRWCFRVSSSSLRFFPSGTPRRNAAERKKAVAFLPPSKFAIAKKRCSSRFAITDSSDYVSPIPPNQLLDLRFFITIPAPRSHRPRFSVFDPRFGRRISHLPFLFRFSWISCTTVFILPACLSFSSPHLVSGGSELIARPWSRRTRSAGPTLWIAG